VSVLGKQISRVYGNRRLDVVVTMDRGFVFAADLLRNVASPTVCHFVREQVRDVQFGNKTRREVLFGSRPDLKGRDVLVLDAVMESGVTQEFLLRRLGGKPAAFVASGSHVGQGFRSARGPGARLLWVPNRI
jgi:hypoxanthine-guanine phosphoribosyltransferase